MKRLLQLPDIHQFNPNPNRNPNLILRNVTRWCCLAVLAYAIASLSPTMSVAASAIPTYTIGLLFFAGCGFAQEPACPLALTRNSKPSTS